MTSEITHLRPDEAEASPLIAPARDHVVPNARIRGQLYAFMALNHLLPTLGTLAAIVLIRHLTPGLFELTISLALYVATGIGITVGFHRYFTHQAFETSRTIRGILAVVGSMAAQGPVIAWAALHRRHHQLSDQPGDPHSPNLVACNSSNRLAGFWHSHVGWVATHDMPKPAIYTPDLLRDGITLAVSRTYLLWYLLGLAIPALAGLAWHGTAQGALLGFLWGGCVRVFVMSNVIWSINSICHMYGRHDHATRDDSKNVVLLALPSLGESWHNNHHAFPSSALFGHRWWQVDIGYLVVKGLEQCHIVWNVKRPPKSERSPSTSGG